MKRFVGSLLASSSLLMSAAQAGDLRDRYKDFPRTNEGLEAHSTQVIATGTELAVSAAYLVVAAGELNEIAKEQLGKSSLGKRMKYILTNKGTRIPGALSLAAAVLAVDGLGRVYLINNNKNPTFTPLPGLIAWVASPKGAIQEADILIKRTDEKLAEGFRYVFVDGILKNIQTHVAKPAVESVKEPQGESESH